MAIIGFIVCFGISLWITFMYLVGIYLTFSAYNLVLGKNKWYTKIMYLALGYILYYMWVKLFEMSPFTVTVT